MPVTFDFIPETGAEPGFDFVPDEAPVTPERVAAAERVMASPAEAWKLEYPGRQMGIFGPAAPEEILAIPEALKIPGAIVEASGIPQAAEDIAVDFLRRTGIDPSAQPGVPMAAIKRIPTMIGGWPMAEELKPQWLKGMEEEAGATISSFLTPGQALLAPAVPFKPVQAMFGATAVSGIPESVQAAIEAPTARERGAAILRTGADIGMAALIGTSLARRGGLPPVTEKAAIEREVQRASEIEKAAEVHGVVRPSPGEGARGVPAEVGRPGVRPEAETMAEPQEVLLRPEDQAHIDAERGNVPFDTEVITTPVDENNPFFGKVATIDRKRGKILLIADEFRKWIADMPEQQRPGAVRSMFAEEANHLATSEGDASGFWSALSNFEKAAFVRIYTGEWGIDAALRRHGEAFEPDTMPFEAVRIRMQQLARMKPTEIASTVGRERWTLEGISAMQRVVSRIYETLPTKGAGTRKAILERVAANLKAAELATGKAAPAVLRRYQREREPDVVIGEVNLMPAEDFATYAKALEPNPTHKSYELGMSVTTPEHLQAMYAARENAAREAKAAFDRGDMDDGAIIAYKSQFFGEAIGAATGSGSAGEYLRKTLPGYRPPFPEAAGEFPPSEIEPAVLRKRRREKTQLEFVLPPVPTGEGRPPSPAMPTPPGELPLARAEPGVERGIPTPSAYQAEVAAYRHVTEITDRIVDDLRAGKKPEPPSFKEFLTELQLDFAGGVRRKDAAAIWGRAVWQRLFNASGEVLMGLRKAMNLRQALGDRDIADPPQRRKFTLEQEATPQGRAAMREQLKGERAAQKYRTTVIGAIGRKLLAQTEEYQKPLQREVAVEDIDFQGRKTIQPAYNLIAASVRNRPETLGPILTADASTFGLAKSKTKRLTVLMNRATQRVEMVSTYLDGRRGPVLLDPDHPQKAHQPLESVLKRYRPLYSVLVSDPVQNFQKTWKSLAAYERDFGQDASRASQTAISEPVPVEGEFVTTPTGGRMARPGVFQAEPGALEVATKAGEPLTRDESLALLDHLYDEVLDLTSAQDIRDALSGLKDKADAGKLSARDWNAIFAYQKIYDAIREKWRILSPEQALDQLTEEVYEKAKQSESSEAFVASAQASYGKGDFEAILGREGGKAPPSPTGRELTMRGRVPPTVTPGEVLPRRPGPTPKLPPYKAPKALTPEELRYVEEEAKRKYPGDSEPAVLRRSAKAASNLVDKTLVDLVRVYSEWMTDKLKRVGGPMSRALGDALDGMISRERELYGQLTPVLDIARRLAGRPGRATTWLHGLSRVTPDAGIMNSVKAIEGTIRVPAYAQQLVDVSSRANVEIGRMYEPVTPDFEATGKFQRNFTGFGFDLLSEGGGLAWEKWTRGIAAANNVPLSEVQGFFRGMKAILDKPDISAARIEKVNQDFARKFPQAVTHIKHAGLWQAVLHADLFNYLETAARRATHVRAFREWFPNDDAGRRAFSDLMRQVRAELPGRYYQQNLDALMRAMQGHPTDTYAGAAILRPGQPLGEVFKFVNQTAANFFAKMVLTGQMFVQPGENLAGATPMFLGYRNYARGLARVRQLYPHLEVQGAVNRVILDYSFDPTSPVRSVFRIGGNVLSKAFMEQFLNEAQEATAAATAAVVSERIRAGRVSAWERMMLPETFKVMGFSPAQAAEMMAGNVELLNRFERRAASFLTSGNKAIAEGSRMGANRLFNSVFRFQTYPMMKTNQLRRLIGNAVDAWQTGTGTEKAAATYLLSRFITGAAAQGAITIGLTSLFYQGTLGAEIRKEEAIDEPVQFLTEATLATMSGPLYLLWQGARDKGLAGIGEKAINSIFPYAMFRELMNYSFEQGGYRDLSEFDKIGKFVRSKVPGSRAISTGLSLAGLSQDNRDLDAGINAFYRWRRETMGFTEFNSFLKTDERKEFRTQIRRVIEAMKDGDQAKYYEAMDAATDAAGSYRKVRESLKARTILRDAANKKLDQEQKEELRRHIGNRAVNLLEDFDAMLESASF